MPRPSKAFSEPDYIVVGGGSAGCVLAARLSEDPDISVLLLEAGGLDWHPLHRIPAGFAMMTKGRTSWGYETVPQKHLGGRKIWFTQAKVIGGGSSINAQLYTRGNPRDYDSWQIPGWGWDDVLPAFKHSERNDRLLDPYHSQGGELGVSDPRGALPICDAFLDAADAFGIPRNPDFNGAKQAGIGYYQLTQRDGQRSSASSAFLKPALKRPNLRRVLRAHVHRILLEGTRAAAVEFRADGISHIRRARCEIILCSGAIGSPAVLQRSGIGPAKVLEDADIDVRHDLPDVGENLSDHLNLCTLWECSGPYSYDGTDRADRALFAGLQYFFTGRGPASSSLFETGGFWYTDVADGWPDIQFHLGLGSGIEKGIARVNGHGITLNSAYLRPASRGTVRVTSADPNKPPLIDPNYWAEPQDRARAFRALEIAREILSQSPLKPWLRREILPRDEDLFSYACRMAKTDHHPVGTCAIGRVVAPDLRVNGLEGLRVADSSVIPSVPSCNTNAPSIMVGERAAAFIRNDRT